MTTFTHPNYLDLSYRPDLGIVTARWKRPVASAELRAGYESILRYAVSCADCRYWLIDSRRRLEVDARDVQWLATTFYPTLRDCLHGHVFLAFLAAPYQLGLVQDDTLPSLPHTHGNYCSLNQFTDEGDAVHWLVAQGAKPRPQAVS